MVCGVHDGWCGVRWGVGRGTWDMNGWKATGLMKHDETLAHLQAIRETVTRIVRDVDEAIAYLEGFQPVVEAFQARQAAVQAQ